MQKYACNAFTPFMAGNDMTRKMRDLYEGSIVTFQEVSKIVNSLEYWYVRDAIGAYGWIYRGYLDVYHDALPYDVVNSPNRTPNPQDASQYAIFFGRQQYNLCGEFAAEDVVERWQKRDARTFERVFRWTSSKAATGTSDGDLMTLFAAFDRSARAITSALADNGIPSRRKGGVYTPQRLRDLLPAGVIVSCRIDGVTGVLRGAGVLHWVALVDVWLDRYRMGGVDLYNPFMDRVERYSWREFVASARAPYGVVV